MDIVFTIFLFSCQTYIFGYTIPIIAMTFTMHRKKPHQISLISYANLNKIGNMI